MNFLTMPLDQLDELIATLKKDIKPATVNHHSQLASLEKQLAIAFDAGKYSVIEDMETASAMRKEEARKAETGQHLQPSDIEGDHLS